MRYRVLDSFKAITPQGEVQLHPGQIITLPHDKAVRLLNEEGCPVEKVAYKVFSEILESYLWVIDTDEDRHALRLRESRRLFTHKMKYMSSRSCRQKPARYSQCQRNFP